MGDRLVTIDIGRKVGELLCPFGGAGSRSNTMWLGPRPTSVPSGILIHPAVWPQWTWAEKWGCCGPFLWGPPLTQCGLGQGIPPYQVAS